MFFAKDNGNCRRRRRWFWSCLVQSIAVFSHSLRSMTVHRGYRWQPGCTTSRGCSWFSLKLCMFSMFLLFSPQRKTRWVMITIMPTPWHTYTFLAGVSCDNAMKHLLFTFEIQYCFCETFQLRGKPYRLIVSLQHFGWACSILTFAEWHQGKLWILTNWRRLGQWHEFSWM